MTNTAEVTKTLTEMAELLERFGPRSWADALRRGAEDYAGEPSATAARIRGMYGGMGSLNDIVLYGPDGTLLADENTRFDELRSKLYQACRYA